MILQHYLSILTKLIIEKYFNETYCAMIFTDSNNELLYVGEQPAIKLNFAVGIQESLIFNYFGCKDIIIQADGPCDVLVQFEKMIKFHDERFNNRKYFILPNIKEIRTKNFANYSKNLYKLFELEEMNYIADILLVTIENEEEFWLSTHKYVGESENNQIILLDKWFIKNESFLYGNNLYPDKISNQQGRKMKIATFTYKPYAIAESSMKKSDGTEMRAAVELIRRYNLTPELIINLEDEWGEIYDNWTGTGLLGNLVMDNGDVGFAALYTWEHEYHFLDLSKPLSRTGITCLVPAPRLSTGWLTPLFSFSIPLWIGVGLSFILSAFSLFVFSSIVKKINFGNRIDKIEEKLCKLFEDSILKVTAVFLLQSISTKQLTSDKVTKYLMACVFILSLLIATSYSSGLASSMTIPRYDNAIKTVQDLIDSGITWTATSDAWLNSIESAEYQTYVTLVKRFAPNTEIVLKSLVPTGKYAFSIERLPYGHYAIGSYIGSDSNLIPMTEDLYWEQCIFMLRKNSVLLPAVDALILRIVESGLPSYWESQVTNKYLDIKLQKAVKFLSHHATEAGSSGPVKLQWVHVEGAFAVLIIGYITACLCFILEMLTYKFKTIRREFIP